MMNSQRAKPGPLVAECRSFTQYLCGRPATSYIERKYQDGHDSMPATAGGGAPWFDSIQLAMARSGPWGTLLVDGYSRWFRPHGAVRYKLTLLLAILETCPPYHRLLTDARTGHPMVLLGRLVMSGVGYTIGLALSVLLFAPLHLLALATRKPSS